MNAMPPGVLLEDAGCPLGCPRGDRMVVEGEDRISHVPGRFTVVACTSCGLKRTNPRPTPDTIGSYYPDSYGPYHGSEDKSPAPGLARGRLKSLLGLETRLIPPIGPGHLLELGSAHGAFLATAQAQGWSVEGIEFSAFAAEKAREQGFFVQVGSAETAEAPATRPDVIAAWMVLEHLHEPLATLKRLREWIKPDGYLIFSVPDASSGVQRLFGEWSFDLQVPNHLYHYSPATLRKLLAASGWRVDRIRWQSNPQTFLRSIVFIAGDKHWPRTGRIAQVLASDPRWGRVRALLGVLLGWTRQSGRIEVWARPAG
jgi:SAM-dependent methyltransferase